MEFLRGEQPTHQPTPQELQSGGMSEEGFLERDQTLEQVLTRDSKALEMMGYSAQEVADLLGPLCEIAKTRNRYNFNYTAANGKEFEVRRENWRGGQECPWRDDEVDHLGLPSILGSIDIYFKEALSIAEEVHVAGLLKHLIKSHGFFEGGAYRVSPEKIVKMLGEERIPGSLEKVNELRI